MAGAGYAGNQSRRPAIGERFCRFVSALLLAIAVGGCTNCGPFVTTFVVFGVAVDSTTGSGLGGIVISLRPLKEGTSIGFVFGNAKNRIVSSSLPVPVTNPDGSFALSVTNGERPNVFGCTAPSPGTFDDAAPDQLQFFLTRDGCTQEILINLTEDTVVDLSFPDNTIELSAPILVPPCGP